MATIDDVKIPPEIVAEMKAMIEAAPDDVILSYAKATPELAKGFRRGSKKSIAPVRKRLVRQLDSDREMDLLLLGIMATGGLSGSLVSRLSDLAIFEIKDALLTVYGRNPVLAALLVDYREEVREIALQILEDELPVETMDHDNARDDIAACLVPILSALPEPEDDTPDDGGNAPPAADAAPEVSALRQRIVELEAELKKHAAAEKREKSLRKKLDTLNQQKQKAEKEVRELNRAAVRETAARADLKTALHTAHDEHRALQATMEERIERGIEERLAAVRNHWLAHPLALEAAADTVRAATGPEELLDEVEQILKRQADIDRHSGNLVVVRERIARLQSAHHRVTTAMAEALHPLPELHDAESRLDEEISRLQSLVGSTAAEEGDFVGRLRARINLAQSEEELVEVQALLDKLDELNAFNPSELQTLYRCCHNRLSIVYAAFTPNVVRKKRYTRDPVWRLINQVEENRDLLIILDGHNVVHLLPILFGETYENGIPGAATRERLVTWMVNTLRDAGKCQAHIFFDAPHPGKVKRADNVWEIYSGGGQAEHRADHAIMDYLETCCKTMSAMPRLLITDDRELRGAAVELGAKFMPVPQFGAFLEEMSK